MKVLTEVDHKNIFYAAVMFTSLGVNIGEHVDLYLTGLDMTSDDFRRIQSFLAGYDISIRDFDDVQNLISDEEMFRIDYDMIVLSMPTGKVDDILSARHVHQLGIKYEDVRKAAHIISFDGGKPWENSDFHFDIEKLWWEYAKLTPWYEDFLTDFVISAMNDTSVEDRIRMLVCKTEEHKKSLNKLYDRLKAVSG